MELCLYESIPLIRIDLTNAVKHFWFRFGHIVGGVMHIAGVPKPMMSLGTQLQSFWNKVLQSTLLVIWSGGDHAHDLCNQPSVSSYFFLLNKVLVSWDC